MVTTSHDAKRTAMGDIWGPRSEEKTFSHRGMMKNTRRAHSLLMPRSLLDLQNLQDHLQDVSDRHLPVLLDHLQDPLPCKDPVGLRGVWLTGGVAPLIEKQSQDSQPMLHVHRRRESRLLREGSLGSHRRASALSDFVLRDVRMTLASQSSFGHRTLDIRNSTVSELESNRKVFADRAKL